MRKLLFALPLALAVPAAAIELSLEENRAERGNIGFIDMQKVFKLLPDTARARESFEDSLRQAEEQVNLRKAELLRLRAELAQMRADREVLSVAPAPIAPPPPPPPAPEPPKPAPKPEPKPDFVVPGQAAAASTATRISSLPGFGGASTEPLVINIPGASTGPVVVQPPSEPQPQPGLTQDELALLNPTTSQAVAAPAPAPTGGTPLELMDKRIAEKEAEIKRKELEYKDHRGKAEKNLLELESRKSEVLLGKIYRAVQEVARKEGVSVVVDKSSILYGHGAVDLTDKVLKQLKGT